MKLKTNVDHPMGRRGKDYYPRPRKDKGYDKKPSVEHEHAWKREKRQGWIAPTFNKESEWNVVEITGVKKARENRKATRGDLVSLAEAFNKAS